MSKRELKKNWEKLEPGYYENGNLGQNLWHYLKLRAIKSVLPKRIGNLLDVGCADGYFLNRVRGILSPKTRIYGLDVSEKLIRSARQKYPRMTFLVADAHKLPFKSGQFDVVLSTETLEHLVNPFSVLLEMKRVLKPQGRIIIELDSGSWLFCLIFWIWVKFFKGRVWQDAHLHRINIEKLEKLFEETELTVEKRIISHLGMAVTSLLKKTK